ncbi:O-antigen ligase family protein [Hymenobacter crusticola]|uniref:Exopolysaccharide transporter n=1 Tax=Hymenobacter crusticola TaxID=1770526 RepID=A0A243W6C2_9BACT|nr:O-antigen ligase family protein [Hymenobacter crusticola]OUJ69830.1 exopolysaccharide transporter [Hymenobacter crusticola]
MRNRDHRRFLRAIQLLLTLVLLIKLAGFFTWSEGVNFTRVFKMTSRLTMTAAVYGTYRLILSRGAVDSFRWQNSLAPLLYGAYLLLGVVSLLWSSDAGYSLLQLVMDAESFVFAFYFVKCFLLLDTFFPTGDIRLYRVLGDAALVLILIFVVGAVVAPETFFRLTHAGEEARLGGFIMNPNELGMLCVVGISCLSFDLYHRHRPTRTIIKMMPLLIALLLTGSRSSLVGLLLLVLLHIQQSGSRRLQLAGVVGLLLAVPVAIQKLFIKQGGLEEVLSLTGRLPFWKALLTEGLPKEPLLGYGFQRIAYTDYFQSTHTYAAQMTHNTFIQALLNLGLIGLSLVVIQLLLTLRGFAAYPVREARLIFLGLLIPILINSFTEFGIFGQTNYGILFYQLLIFLISLHYNPLLTTAEKLFLQRCRPELMFAQ